VLVIAAFIVRAVRLTNASLAMAARHVDPTNPDVARSVVDQIRGRNPRCPRCGEQTFALLDTENRYKCESCDFTFTGPAHISGSTAQDEPLHPS
jgi:ribosomal protein S27AE